MRAKRVNQRGLEYSQPHLKITREYYARYEAVSSVLDQVPEVLDRVHRDPAKTLTAVNREGRGRRPEYTTEHVLRILVCQVVEGASLREIVVRVDDSEFLRRFTRIDNGTMMDFTTLCGLKNAIAEKTWKAINRCLAEHAAQNERIGGDKLRLDTTAVETNIHWPTDSSLLWDVYRTFGRLIRQAREIDPEVVGPRCLQARRAKRLQQRIARRAASKGRSAEQLKPLYVQLIRMVEDLFGWARSVGQELSDSQRFSSVVQIAQAGAIVQQIEHFLALGERVVDQARRRGWMVDRGAMLARQAAAWRPPDRLPPLPSDAPQTEVGGDVSNPERIEATHVAPSYPDRAMQWSPAFRLGW